ncbi:hypothetical protein HHI36_019932 [Cryptolaemus montrouzieri]|uniref:Uncharacterized protein n=1 Tax=Cryptolaemus montrouzieri TaxID=559131 RepID=A0ABD2N935_9CUCU
MLNCGGPSCRSRRLYSAVAHSIGLHASPLWAKAAATVSAAAAEVLSGTPPMVLLAEENRRLMEHRYGHQPGVQRPTRKRIVVFWQDIEGWMKELLSERATPEKIMRHLIDEPNKWQKGARIISDIMKEKEREDSENQREDPNEEKD